MAWYSVKHRDYFTFTLLCEHMYCISFIIQPFFHYTPPDSEINDKPVVWKFKCIVNGHQRNFHTMLQIWTSVNIKHFYELMNIVHIWCSPLICNIEIKNEFSLFQMWIHVFPSQTQRLSHGSINFSPRFLCRDQLVRLAEKFFYWTLLALKERDSLHSNESQFCTDFKRLFCARFHNRKIPLLEAGKLSRYSD